MNSPPRCKCPKRCSCTEVDYWADDDLIVRGLQAYYFDFDDSQNDHRLEDPKFDDEVDEAFSKLRIQAPQPSQKELNALGGDDEWTLVPKGGKVNPPPAKQSPVT